MTMHFRALLIAVITLSAACLIAQAAPAPGRRAATTRPLPPAPEGVVIDQDVAFLEPDRKDRLDLYLPADRDPSKRLPAIVTIHGGGWVGGDKTGAREFQIGTTLVKAGYVVASVNYRLDPPRWPGNLHDCKNAVRFLRANAAKYGIDPDRIGVIGGSAGGHLALMVAYTTDVPGLEPGAPYPGVSSNVSAVVDLYGITNVLTRRKTDDEGNPLAGSSKQTALFTTTADEDPALWRRASPVSHVQKDSPPTLILHGTKDTTVDRDQATELAAKLKEAGAVHEIMMIEGVGHTFDLETWRKQPLPRDLRPVVIDFFDRHVKNAKRP